MKKPPLAANEGQRLAALRALNILDTPPEERFDRITQLARRLFEIPIALITLVDAERQWFKSCQGLRVRETPRDISFCGHAILAQEGLVVPDTLLDERFADNPLVLGETGIRFYAGQPLRATDGSQVGVLCIEDHLPRSWRAEDRELLRDLAHLVEDQLHLIEISELRRETLERTRAEEALRLANERLELALRGSNVGVWDNQIPDGEFKHGFRNYVNFWEQLGHNGRPPGQSALDAMHPDDRARVEDEAQRFFAGQANHYETEARYLHTDGSYRTWLARGVAERDTTGKPIRFLGMTMDITRLKRAEEALRQANERVELAVRSSNICIWECDMPDGRIENAHLTLFNVWESIGYDARTSPTDFSSAFAGYFHPDDQERVGRELHALLAGDGHEWKNEYRVLVKDGSIRWLLARGTVVRDPDGKPVRFIGTSTDITDRKRTEEALRHANARLDLAVRGSNVGIWDHDTPDDDYQQRRRHYVNVWEQLGYECSPPGMDGPFDAVHPDDRVRAEEAVRRYLAGESAEYEAEARFRHREGSYRTLLVRGVAVRDAAGKPIRFSGVTVDITQLKLAEETLRERERQLDSLMGHLPGLAYRAVADEHWTASFASKGVEDLTGYPADEFTSHRLNYADIMLPEDRPATREAVIAALRERRMYEVEHRIRHKDGSVRWIWARGHGVFAPDGSLRFIEGLNLDMTSRKQAEEALRESEERFRGTFENAAVGITHNDSSGRFLRVNGTYCDIIGYSREELLQMTLQDIIHPDEVPAFLKFYSSHYARGESPPVGFERRYQRKDGSTVWVEVFPSFQRDASGRPTYTIAAIQDISERKRLEGELRRAKEVAEAANRAKDEFLANVSHEIRTPMNAILGMAELTLDTMLTDEQRSNLNIVLTSAESLLTLINDLLDFSKIEAGRLEMEEVDFSLRTVLNQTLRALALRAHKKGMELACQVEQDVPDGLVGDGNRLRQVLLNLIGNAIKFTDAGEAIVRVRAHETNHLSVLIDFEIADTGIGIAPEKQRTIFLPFEQGDSSTTRRYGGTGLGLTISSRLVEMMGGKITVESELGRGSTFRFSARFGRSSRLAAAPAQPPVVDLHGLRVLIVDDNATNRTILHGWAGAWGMNPTATADVPAAMSALWRGVASKEPFALVLLDARMPGMDGLELAKEISQTPELSTCRIILLTSDDRPGDARRYRDLRISAVLMKPVQQEELLDNIYRVLSHGAHGTGVAEPVRVTSSNSVQEPPTEIRPSRRLNVLVAEDNKFNQQVIQRMLERRGHTVRVVPNGNETLAALRQSAFDLLLLDVNMPEIDGFQVIQTTRELEKTSNNHLRVIALTALSGKRDRERCIEAGMDDFLSKPVRAAEVYAALERVIAVHPIAHPDAPAESPALIDTATLLSGCAGDAALLSDMIQLFEEEAPQLLAGVEAAMRSADAEQLRKASHALRGLVSAFSSSASMAVEILERMGTDRRASQAEDEYKRVIQIVQDLRAALTTVTIEKLHERG
jgi:two-component system sensor histidine kinase/response regulator